MIHDSLIDELSDLYDGLIRMDGYDDCVIGVIETFGHEPRLCYDQRKVIWSLMKQGSTREEAEEYFSYNMIGAYHGERTPCFLIPIQDILSFHHGFESSDQGGGSTPYAAM